MEPDGSQFRQIRKSMILQSADKRIIPHAGRKRNLFDKREQSQARLGYAERKKVAYEIRTVYMPEIAYLSSTLPDCLRARELRSRPNASLRPSQSCLPTLRR